MRRILLRLAPSSTPNTYVQTRFFSHAVKKQLAWNNNPADIQPGQHVISVCKEYNIGFPQKLRSLRVFRQKENPYKLGVFVCQQHCFAQNSMRYFDKLEHPFAKSLLDIYIEKKKESLWITSYAHGAGVFPNKTAQRKIAHALRDALMAAGYDRFGRRVLADGESSAIVDLYGSLRVISAHPTALCNAKFVDILECAKKIIAGVEIELRRGDADIRFTQKKDDQNHRHVQRPQQHPQRQPTFGARQSQTRGPNIQRGRQPISNSY
ncbi:hypothetical protein FHL15_000629 [Xylaria flabelliformis]|uniref:Uncharacterized protein n=1 Tax=Xylaria flabelliformis TaxID=2512241 RepID=A0A553IEC8_9PEZI|nr:hypothetical protein FHL15_000629 [Xylaria flabelliformis]